VPLSKDLELHEIRDDSLKGGYLCFVDRCPIALVEETVADVVRARKRRVDRRGSLWR